MNQLSLEKRTQIISLLVEGNSLRGAARISDVSVVTVAKLLVDVGRACQKFHNEMVVNLNSKRIECDEQWGYIYSKQKNVTKNKVKANYAGDAWTWVGMDADSRLIVDWYVGKRDAESAEIFMKSLAARLKNQVQLSTDGLRTYLDAVESAFEGKVDYAQLVKQYGTSEKDGKKDNRSQYIGAEKMRICGHPDMGKLSTSYVERQNLTVRMSMRRFIRKTNGYSKKYENHCCAIALHYVYYNFVRIHHTLRVTPAMEAGLTNKLMEISDIVKLADENQVKSN
jgi:IS1 family transposase